MHCRKRVLFKNVIRESMAVPLNMRLRMQPRSATV